MSQRKRRIKWGLALLLPVALFVSLRTAYATTPQYAFKSFLAAVRAGNEAEVRRLSTGQFSKLKIPLQHLQAVEAKITGSGNLKWRRFNSTQALVYVFPVGRYNAEYRFHLLKTTEGWKLSDYEYGFYGVPR